MGKRSEKKRKREGKIGIKMLFSFFYSYTQWSFFRSKQIKMFLDYYLVNYIRYNF